MRDYKNFLDSNQSDYDKFSEDRKKNVVNTVAFGTLHEDAKSTGIYKYIIDYIIKGYWEDDLLRLYYKQRITEIDKYTKEKTAHELLKILYALTSNPLVIDNDNINSASENLAYYIVDNNLAEPNTVKCIIHAYEYIHESIDENCANLFLEYYKKLAIEKNNELLRPPFFHDLSRYQRKAYNVFSETYIEIQKAKVITILENSNDKIQEIINCFDTNISQDYYNIGRFKIIVCDENDLINAICQIREQEKLRIIKLILDPQFFSPQDPLRDEIHHKIKIAMDNIKDLNPKFYSIFLNN